MDGRAAREAASLVALMIGEIMEDHVDRAVMEASMRPGEWAAALTLAGDIAALGRALAVIGRRAEVSRSWPIETGHGCDRSVMTTPGA